MKSLMVILFAVAFLGCELVDVKPPDVPPVPLPLSKVIEKHNFEVAFPHIEENLLLEDMAVAGNYLVVTVQNEEISLGNFLRLQKKTVGNKPSIVIWSRKACDVNWWREKVTIVSTPEGRDDLYHALERLVQEKFEPSCTSAQSTHPVLQTARRNGDDLPLAIGCEDVSWNEVIKGSTPLFHRDIPGLFEIPLTDPHLEGKCVQRYKNLYLVDAQNPSAEYKILAAKVELYSKGLKGGFFGYRYPALFLLVDVSEIPKHLREGLPPGNFFEVHVAGYWRRDATTLKQFRYGEKEGQYTPLLYSSDRSSIFSSERFFRFLEEHPTHLDPR